MLNGEESNPYNRPMAVSPEVTLVGTLEGPRPVDVLHLKFRNLLSYRMLHANGTFGCHLLVLFLRTAWTRRPTPYSMVTALVCLLGLIDTLPCTTNWLVL